MSTIQIASRGEFQSVIDENCAKSGNYREALVSDPKAVIEKHLGHPLPQGLNIEVVEERPNTLYVVAPAPANDELSDEDLEMVAGGKQDTRMNDVDCSRAIGLMASVTSIQAEVSLV